MLSESLFGLSPTSEEEEEEEELAETFGANAETGTGPTGATFYLSLSGH